MVAQAARAESCVVPVAAYAEAVTARTEATIACIEDEIAHAEAAMSWVEDSTGKTDAMASQSAPK